MALAIWLWPGTPEHSTWRGCHELLGTEIVDQKKQKLADFKGNLVLVDVWAIWCGSCRAMIPHERELVKRLEGKPFKLLSVSGRQEEDIDEVPRTGADALDSLVVRGPEQLDAQDAPCAGFPTLHLIDAKGVIRRKWLGSPEPEVLDEAIDELVKAAVANG
jgi:thiol-disulfide isomerase/thioredoxin